MTTKTICPSCNILKVEQPILNINKANWAHERNNSINFINSTPLKIKKQKMYDFTKHINVGIINKNKYVLYWASEKSRDAINVKKITDAYNNFSNYGVAIVDKTGDFKIYLEIPQNYSDINEKNNTETYYKHIHFVLSDEKKKYWKTNDIYTYLVIPEYDFQSFIKLTKSNNAVMINSSSFRDYSIKHIPNTYNLPFNKLYDMNNKEVDEWMLNLIKNNYPLFAYVLNQYAKWNTAQFGNKLHELPIIIYNNDENKKDILKKYAENLIYKGFVNICVFTGGLIEYNKNNQLIRKSMPTLLLSNKYTLRRKKRRKYYTIKKF